MYLLLNVRILSTRYVAAKAASVSNFSLRREVTMEVKINTCDSNIVEIVKQKISKQEEGSIGEVMKSESECQYEIEDAEDEVS